jgi:hypothetical protein
MISAELSEAVVGLSSFVKRDGAPGRQGDKFQADMLAS